MHKVLLVAKARVASVVTVGGYPDLRLYWYKLFSGVVVIAWSVTSSKTTYFIGNLYWYNYR